MEHQRRVMNRRPLLLAAVALAAGIMLGRFIHLSIPYIVAAVVLAAAAFIIVILKRKAGVAHPKPGKAVIGLACAALGMLGAFLTANIMTAGTVQTGEALAVTGCVYSEPYVNDSGSTVVLLDHARIGGVECGNIKLYVTDGAALHCGDEVETSAKVELPKGVRNPGGFDDRLHLLSQGVYYKAYTDTVRITGNYVGLGVLFIQARQELSGVVDTVFEPDVAPIAKAMLLGDTRGIDEDTSAAFKDTGMAHVLAVSGLNAAILVAFVYFVLRLLRAGRTLRLVVTLVFIVAYACVTGLTPSIVRASLMACAVLIGRYMGRQADTLNCVALSFVAALLLRPLDLFTAGFQLSYGAVLGMITLGSQIDRWLKPKLPARLQWAGNTLSASVGATAGTAPILAATFNRVSTLSILINIVVIPLASAATVLVFIVTFIGIFFAPAAVYIGYAAAAVIRVMLWFIRAASTISFAAMNIASPPAYMVLAGFVLLLICSKYVLIKTRLKAILSGVLVAAVVAAALLARPAGMYVVFLDVGQGDAAFVRTAQGGEYLIDGGCEQSAEEVVSFTVRQGITPDAAFVSHTDSDHFAGLVALYGAGLLHKVYCSAQEEETVRAAMPEAQVVPLSAGDVVLLDDMTRAVVLYPYPDTVSQDKNEQSLVLLIEYGDHTMLFTGDIPGAVETRVFASLGGVDIYKAAHHGSQYSSYRLPLSALSPEYSVMSVGENSFGQPSELALENLEDYSDEVFLTIEDYAVEFYIDDSIRIHTYGG